MYVVRQEDRATRREAMHVNLNIPAVFMPIGVALIGWHFGQALGAGLALVGLWLLFIALDKWSYPF